MSLRDRDIVVAMSGGVDSSVTAALLKEAGARVRGVFMELAQPDVRHQAERAAAVAAFLGIPLRLIDLRQAFQRQVLQPFAASYFAGRTPNPCVGCNRLIKCGRLLDWVTKQGGELLATGHYARIVADEAGRRHLLRGVDREKDQSYFLCQLGPEQLSRLVFPLGGYRKQEVRGLAAELGLAGRHGRESQDVCFLAGQPLPEFLEALAPSAAQPGPIVSRAGRLLGRHRGIHRYTVGQRRGLGIPDVTPYYVLALDPERRAVVVGKEQELYQQELLLTGVNWLAGRPASLPARFLVRPRYRHPGVEATVAEAEEGRLRIVFAAPQRAVAPGQFAVLYQGEEVMAGGEILGPAGEGRQ